MGLDVDDRSRPSTELSGRLGVHLGVRRDVVEPLPCSSH